MGSIGRIGVLVIALLLGVLLAVGVDAAFLGPDPAWQFDCSDTTCEDLWVTARTHDRRIAVACVVTAALGWVLVTAGRPRTSPHPADDRRALPIAVALSALVPLVAALTGLAAVMISAPLGLAVLLAWLLVLALAHRHTLVRATGRDRLATALGGLIALGGAIAGGTAAALAFSLLLALPDLGRLPGLALLAVPFLASGIVLIAALLAARRAITLADVTEREPATPVRSNVPTSVAAALLVPFAVWAAWPVPAPPADAWRYPDPPPIEAIPDATPVITPTATSDSQPISPEPTPIGLPACDPGELRMEVGGWDGTMGNSAATIRAVNEGTEACALTGRPVLDIAQGGEDLHLDVQEMPEYRDQVGARYPDGMALAPQQPAEATLFWPGYRNAADQRTPQSASIRLSPGGAGIPAALDPGPGPAPFDLVPGARLEVGRWHPAA